MTLAVLIGCRPTPTQVNFVKVNDLVNEQDAMEKFSSLSIDEQIDVYLFSLTHVEGPRWDYGKFLAANDSMAVAPIIERMKINQDSILQFYLIDALGSINNDCKCIGNNKNIIRTLDELAPKVPANNAGETYYILYRDVLEAIQNGE